MRRPLIYAVESHDEVLGLLRAAGTRAGRVVHLDFHCDMRGLLIDRRNGVAHRIWDRNDALDEGNFLTYAILEGIVSQLLWVHDRPGGRRHDLQTVKYESDWSALPHRLAIAATHAKGVAIDYEVVTQDAWDGSTDGWILDIDWDYFAAREYPASSVEARVDRFLNRQLEGTPELCFVCYSASYSHPTRVAYLDFVASLADRWGSEVVHGPAPIPERPRSRAQTMLGPFHAPTRKAYRSLGLALRSRGIY